MITATSEKAKARIRIRELIDKLKGYKNKDYYEIAQHKVIATIRFSCDIELITPEEETRFIEEINNI